MKPSCRPYFQSIGTFFSRSCARLRRRFSQKPTPTFSDLPLRYFPLNMIGKISTCHLMIYLIPSEFLCGCFTWHFSTVKDSEEMGPDESLVCRLFGYEDTPCFRD